MPATQIHLVRHGEVHNPEGVLYGRIPGYHLSELGRRMAARAADALKARNAPVVRIISSPLQRAQESAEPFSTVFGLPVETEDRLIEPTNKFEGQTFEFGPQVLLKPRTWPWVLNPFRPSWGEAYRSIATRMLAAIDDAWTSTESGDVVMVSHQLPIWMVARELSGDTLYHDPRKRRCHLSSITTLERIDGTFVEVRYEDPAGELLAQAVDTGAV